MILVVPAVHLAHPALLVSMGKMVNQENLELRVLPDLQGKFQFFPVTSFHILIFLRALTALQALPGHQDLRDLGGNQDQKD